MPDRNFTIRQTLLVALIVSLVCSIIVAGAAVLLEPLQQRNKQQAIREDILDVAGLLDPARSIEQSFENIETRLVDLASGDYVEGDANAFDARRAARDPQTSVAVPAELDIAQIDRRPKLAR
ncbi:MAG: Na(+)-translocating NADH-quinone reductase subunit C, partial [Gammaproteobacteria bacterium]|nr:Na(+)-translocating NADH-quinone reductase subunit C [Gammaproteobacteria bacterium]